MRKLIMILVMTMAAFGSFAKDFEYKSGNEEWTYTEKDRTVYYNYRPSFGPEYNVGTYDVSEDEAWKIIHGEEFPTFVFLKFEETYASKTVVYISRMPCRDYSNRSN